LELAAGPGLEAAQPPHDAVLDRRVVADVEVQVAERLQRSPVAAVEHAILLHVERARDPPARAPGQDAAHAIPPALPEDLEDALVEVALSPRIRVDRVAVQPVDDGDERLGDLVADERLHAHPPPSPPAALPPNLVATLAAQALQVVVERPEAAVRPVVLVAGAVQPAARRQHVALVVGTEVHVRRREALPRTEGLQRLAERRRHRGVPSGGGEEALPGHGRERHGDEQLRIVRDAGAMRGRRPAVVEDELAVAVSLDVERARADHPRVVPERQALRQPPRVRPPGPRLLARRQPPPPPPPPPPPRPPPPPSQSHSRNGDPSSPTSPFQASRGTSRRDSTTRSMVTGSE